MVTDQIARRLRRHIGMPLVAIALLGGVLASGATSASTSPNAHRPKFLVKYESEPTYGLILSTAAGYPLYVYAGDTKNNSTVTGTKLAAWPPLVLPPGDALTLARHLHKALGKFTLPTGQVQVTWHGMPLYTFVKDVAPDLVTGEGKGAIFRVVQVARTK